MRSLPVCKVYKLIKSDLLSEGQLKGSRFEVLKVSDSVIFLISNKINEQILIAFTHLELGSRHRLLWQSEPHTELSCRRSRSTVGSRSNRL